MKLKPEKTRRKEASPRVALKSIDGQIQKKPISHLVLLAFVGPCPPDKEQAAHWDGNPKNNSLENLRWATRHENEEDKKRHGTHQTGSGNPAAKVNEAQVREIRRRKGNGESNRKIAAAFGLSPATVKDIVRRRSWVHI